MLHVMHEIMKADVGPVSLLPCIQFSRYGCNDADASLPQTTLFCLRLILIIVCLSFFNFNYSIFRVVHSVFQSSLIRPRGALTAAPYRSLVLICGNDLW